MLINIIAFKIGWLSSVVGVAYGAPMVGTLVVMLLIAFHVAMSLQPANELLLIFLTGLIGAGADSLMISAGWLSYPTGTLIQGLSPYWIVAMWMLFATTFNVSFRWLKSHLPVAALFGAVSGPLSYYFGAKFSAVTLNEFWPAMIALAASWSALMPILLILARRLDGSAVPALSRGA